MFFFQRSDRGHRKYSLYAELFESMNIGAEIQFTGKNSVTAPMAGEKSNLAAFERAQHIWVGRRAERGFQSGLVEFRSGRAWSTSHCRR